MNSHWLDQSLKRWATWYLKRNLDKSMGWPNKSAIARMDTPPATGNVWDYDNFESDWSDCVELDEFMRTKLAKSNPEAYKIIQQYYIEGKWVMRSAARLHGCHHNTFEKKLGMALAQLDYLLAAKNTVDKPLQTLTV